MFYCNILYQRTCCIAAFYYEVNIIGNKMAFAPYPETINLSLHISFISGAFSQGQKTGVYIKIITTGQYVF